MQDENILDQNKEIARRFYEECWNQGKVDRLDQLIAKDCLPRSSVSFARARRRQPETAHHHVPECVPRPPLHA